MVAQRLKRLAARQETQVQSLGQEDALEMEMATHSSIVAWRILERSLVGYSPRGRKESDMTERLNFHFHFTIQLPLNKNRIETMLRLLISYKELTMYCDYSYTP